MAEAAFKIEVDSSDIDVALEKAERLKTTLEQAKALQAELATSQSVYVHVSGGNRVSRADIDRLVAEINSAIDDGVRLR
jgi:hypothetical protein